MRAAVDRVGGAYAPTTTLTNVFGSTKHDGADTYYSLAYDPGCTCFKYVGGLQPMVRLPGQ